MRGFPKRFNTKQDVLNTLPSYPKETKEFLQTILNTRKNWLIVKVLEDGEQGINNLTNRVQEHKDDNDVVIQRVQEEYKKDPNATMYRLGFTVTEIEELLQE